MDNVVSARRLRKSMLKGCNQNQLYDIGYLGKDSFEVSAFDKYKNSVHAEEICSKENEKKSKKLDLKTKVIIKIFFTCLFLTICLVTKLAYKEQALSNKYVLILKREYKKDYSKEYIAEKLEDVSNFVYSSIGKYALPVEVKDKLVTNYVGKIKPYILEFNLKQMITTTNDEEIVTEKSISSYSIEEETAAVYNGLNGVEPIETNAYFESASAVSLMQNDITEILSKNISIISPLSGTITSVYGARDVIFEGVNSYHTGLDIAAKSGTNIKSATTGKVVKVQEMDKYYGNNVIIETNGVRFRYAHMLNINVKMDQEISQGDIIGTVGSTGMSTGPHLHLEIIINSRTVNPQSIFDF